MGSLAQELSVLVGDAFEQAGLDRTLGRVSVSDRSDLAQFQCNGAMGAAKAAKKNPREVAGAVAEILLQNPAFSKVEIAGPGFINLNVTDEFLTNYLVKIASDEKSGMTDIGRGETAVLDYGGPNIAKAMHVGHLRSAIIGEAVWRVMDFCGYRALGDVHLGDWGTHMGMLIGDYVESGDAQKVTDTDLDDAAQVDALMDDMAERYPRAATAAKENADLMERARAITVQLQDKTEPYYSLWEKIRLVSVMGMKRNYAALGVHFDLWKGEADVHDYIAPMVEDLKARGYAVDSDGAVVFPVAQNDDKKEYPPLILYKRDGAVMYGTTDMATIVERVKLYNPAKIIYIVDQRQALHFEQVFRAVRKGGIVRGDVELTHAGFGTMNGPDGKPFKTRAGGVMRLDDLIAMAVEKARARMEEAKVGADFSKEEQADIAHKVAIAAIKFADLQNQRHADYVFDLDRLTSFEGKTGPYLLYQAVRIKSLLRKAGYDINAVPSLALQDGDRALALVLTEMPDAVEASLKNYAPHHLCDYAYRVAQAFSSFYGNCHILSEENETVRASRLSLCAQTYRKLELVLNLLGIEIPERM
ncbi:MAG: arginine--tRNA ligase [Micavibrio aeruginosavorus]|uniref:Arginine--tRNA ligase n=1 Tax=Micavibrio aeruginosavorus TaxID=349221 RepID=A0A2W4ZZG1_9BACT|nr:MAG: arginine--tRNA ligase [Micavibrio aeruginosavorus]